MAIRRTRLYGITRVDHPATRTFSWLVRLQRARKVYMRRFSDGVHGGKAPALRAALAWRDHLLETAKPLPKWEYVQVLRRNNRSGYSGVGRHCTIDRNPQGRILRHRWYWVATWTPVPGQPAKQRKFSVSRYGEQGAFRKALAFRRQTVAELEETFQVGLFNSQH